ncbi:hypothetical protein DCAR_0100829 [Daucus carota subsp. sativus]|uniref:Response regulatory domain-containing protein n=1 Tax=Daucus carota subsp. sativus TaxID=79200 RepID=A0A166FYC1_DAUCS|nr:PREDICTED: two-component response regulator ARR22-like [Daucus carota subsp. sativus]WOG81678.1 hypothetical protein DCAR_0100829 [Daucus carota subsp. sativus]
MASPLGSSMTSAKRQSALVVDDDPVTRIITRGLLNYFGFEVSTLNDGIEVVNMYEAGKGHFDLIITDMEMPVMNGIEATKKLRSLGVGCKIIGVSSCDDETSRRHFLEAGLDHLFYKPLNVTKLQSCLENN